MTAVERQQKYLAKLREDGICISCRRIYTPINPKTEKPFWYCLGCRSRAAGVYQVTGRRYYWQRKLELSA